MKYILAPLAGFTDAAFRSMCLDGGSDVVYAEMVSAAAIAHDHKATFYLCETLPGERNVVMQIFGANELDIAVATRRLHDFAADRFIALNLNAGCPMDKVTRCGAGSKLIEDPRKIARLLHIMRDNTDLPISLKTRLGPRPGDKRIFEIIDAANQERVSSIAVHARYTSQLHGGPLDLETLADVVASSSVPIIGNGSIVDRKSAALFAATGVAGLMIGRAALSNPCIFAQLKGYETPNVGKMQLLEKHLTLLIDLHTRLRTKYPDGHLPSLDGFISVKMHTHLFRYFNGMPGAAAIRARLNKIRTLREIAEIIAEYKN